MTQFALVTKTFRGDLELFAQLCRTIDRHMPDARHYVLVDTADAAMFAPFGNGRRQIVNCAELLPRMRELDLFGQRLWWRAPFTLVRGWIYQQLAKIAFVASMSEDAAVIVDSDLYLLNAIRHEQVFTGGRTRIYRNPGGGRGKQHRKWHRIAQQLLGLPEGGYQGFDYIGQGVVWSPQVVREMIARIEAVSRRPWLDVLAAKFRFSEYLLYGIFCDQFEGPHQQLVCPSVPDHWHLSWHYDLSSDVEIETFINSVSPHHLGVLIQSNLRMPSGQRSAIIDRIEHTYRDRSQ